MERSTLTEEAKKALHSIRLLVNRMVAYPDTRTTENLEHLLRFCDEGGVPAQILRGTSPDPSSARKDKVPDQTPIAKNDVCTQCDGALSWNGDAIVCDACGATQKDRPEYK